MFNMQIYIVVSMIADDKNIVLYFADGTERVLPTDLKITQNIVDKVTEALSNGQTVELMDNDFDEHKYFNIYPKVEEQIKGIKFFRTLKKWFTGDTQSSLNQRETVFLPVGNHTELTDEETLVAVVENQDDATAEPVVIPHVENLAPQIEHIANGEMNSVGLEKFITRLSKVISKRQHSVEDLLAFLRQNDLPITDDGCILAYKRLLSRDGYFVDTHTRKVQQNVGSIVEVDESLVDPDRRNECSNGLHVGRKDYMGSFSGDAIFIVKVAPEDVIAVPRDYGRSKMRTCRYHVLHAVNKEAFNNIVSRESSLTYDQKMEKLLANLVAGNYPEAKEAVKIGGHRGTDITVTKLNDELVDLRDNVEPVQATMEATSPTAVALNGEPTEGAAKAAPSVSEEAKPKAATKAKQAKKKPTKKAIKTLNTKAADKNENKKAAKPVTVKDIKNKVAPKTEPAPVAKPDGLSKDQLKKLKADLDSIKKGKLTKTQVAAKWGIARSTLAKWEEKYFPSK